MTQDRPSPPKPAAGGDEEIFGIDVTDEGHEVVARVRGEVDLAASEEFRNSLTEYARPHQRIVLDLSAVTFMDSCGIRALLQLHNLLVAVDGTLIVRNPSARARDVIALVGITEVFEDHAPPS